MVPPCKLEICNFAKFSTNTSILLSFAHYRESLRLTYTNFSHGTGTHLDCFPYIYKMSALCKLKICNSAKNINTSALLFFAHYHAGAGAQFTGLCTDPPVRFPSNAYKTKDIPQGYVFLFGTPIGNRTLVSAVRGRRLEPLDHEGKSILLCDNSIIFVHTQAKIDNLRIFYLMNFLIKNYQLHIDFYYLIM